MDNLIDIGLNLMHKSFKDKEKIYVENTVGKFTKNDALIACPSLGSSSVESALKKLVEDKTISRKESGKNTFYVRNN